MAKNKNDYFALLTEQSHYSLQAAHLLTDILAGYRAAEIEDHRTRMHTIENQADKLAHRIQTDLYTEFITPIDQEDILQLSQLIDDITDAIDEVVLECYMYHIAALPGKAVDLAAMVQRCVAALASAVSELKNFKKPAELRGYLKEVNRVEAEADSVFADAIYHLFSTESECKTLIGLKALYECLEDCCDQCEHAADLIERIIMKNT